MEHLVDLDDLAAKLGSHISQWATIATVSALTWRDEKASWPQPIVTDRAAVEVPESLGFTVSTGADDVLQVVVWAGGWADADALKDGTISTPHLTFSDADEALAAVVSFVGGFLP